MCIRDRGPPAHQAACVPDGRVHQRHPGRFLVQLSGQSPHAGNAGAGAVHHRFWGVGAAGRRLPVRGGLYPQSVSYTHLDVYKRQVHEQHGALLQGIAVEDVVAEPLV